MTAKTGFLVSLSHEIVDSDLKRPGEVFRLTEIAHSCPVNESEGPHHERPLKMFEEHRKRVKVVNGKKVVQNLFQ